MNELAVDLIFALFLLIMECILLWTIYKAIRYKKTQVAARDKPGQPDISLHNAPVAFVVLVMAWICFASVVGIFLYAMLARAYGHWIG